MAVHACVHASILCVHAHMCTYQVVPEWILVCLLRYHQAGYQI